MTSKIYISDEKLQAILNAASDLNKFIGSEISVVANLKSRDCRARNGIISITIEHKDQLELFQLAWTSSLHYL